MEQQQMTPEQVEALKEKLAAMSPEELAEFQKQQCIFCQIITGKVPSKVVYDDEGVIGLLDINPANTGHVLLLPKEHFQIMPQLPPELIRKMFVTAKKLSQAMLRGMKAKGTNIFVANGVAAGQRAQHFMIHIIPRFDNDGVGLEIPENQETPENLHAIARQLGTQQPDIEKPGPAEKPTKDTPKEEPKTKGPIKKNNEEGSQEKKENSERKEELGSSVDIEDIANVLRGNL